MSQHISRAYNPYSEPASAQARGFQVNFTEAGGGLCCVTLCLSVKWLCPCSYPHLPGWLCLWRGSGGFPALPDCLLSPKRVSLCHWNPLFCVSLFPWVSELKTLLSHGRELWLFPATSCSFQRDMYVSESVKAEERPRLGRMKGGLFNIYSF